MLGLLIASVPIACGGGSPPLPPPTISSIEPGTALTSGGASVRIVGTGFHGVTLTVGGVRADYTGAGSTIYAVMPAHTAGFVDITVTNHDRQSATAVGALTYLAIQDFDFNGVWEGRAVPDEFTAPFQLTVAHDHVVSLTCGSSGVIALDPAPPVRDGKFAYTGANGLTIDGIIRRPTGMDGAVNAPSCVATHWYADKT